MALIYNGNNNITTLYYFSIVAGYSGFSRE